jgi:murein DD-endopeptidase MepM/ murein hydrolase activator NlpD
MRTKVAPTLISLAIIGAVTFASAPASGVDGWLRPVPGRVVRPFQAPLTRYGRGHLGVDFAAAPGTPVRAAGAGTVVFAGLVANARHVVVRHAGGLRTSYSFLASIRVRGGEVVARGEVVGTSGGRGAHHLPDVVHFGLRIGDVYVDPMRLFASGGLPARVHLVPVSADASTRSVAGRLAERRALIAGLPRAAPVVPAASASGPAPGA